MEVSLFLAKFIGLFLLIQGITLFLRSSDLKGMAREFSKSPVLQIFIGCVGVIAGLSIVMVHNVWGTYWQSLISVFGWLTLVKGAMLLWSPELIKDVVEVFERPGVLRVASMTVYTLAIILLSYGFGFAQ